jgi:hypothetical protein
MLSENLPIKQNLSNKEASTYLGCAPNSLKQSRVTGTLFGVQAPAFLKMGYNIRYKLNTLEKWLSQFSEFDNTAQTNSQ